MGHVWNVRVTLQSNTGLLRSWVHVQQFLGLLLKFVRNVKILVALAQCSTCLAMVVQHVRRHGARPDVPVEVACLVRIKHAGGWLQPREFCASFPQCERGIDHRFAIHEKGPIEEAEEGGGLATTSGGPEKLVAPPRAAVAGARCDDGRVVDAKVGTDSRFPCSRRIFGQRRNQDEHGAGTHFVDTWQRL